ncbi:MAG: PIN domain-containing protein, partial [Acidobacteriota bacterium]
MVLVDTSVWITHLHRPAGRLKALLEERRVFCHPLVIGELACGVLPNRAEFFALIHYLPTARTASHEEVLDFIERKQLWGAGLGYIDVHLLASALLTNIHLWTADKHLLAAAETLGV